MASRDSSLESVTSRSSEQGITIGLIGLGGTQKKSIGWHFLLDFFKDSWYKWHASNNPPIKILINNRDTEDKIEYVETFIEEDLLRRARGMRDSHPGLEDMISKYIKAARVEQVANEAEAILVAYDSGIDEPEIVPASRFIVQNANLATMLTYPIEITGEDGKPETSTMVDVLGKSKALKFMITNCVDYMTYFSQRHLMREYIKGNEKLLKLVRKLSKKDKNWEFQDDLLGIPGKHLAEALQQYNDDSREYLQFLSRSWFGFAQVDISRLMYETEDLLKEKFGLSIEDYDLEGLFFSGEHGKFGDPALSSLRVVLHDAELKEQHPNLEFPFQTGGALEMHRNYPPQVHPKDSLPVSIKAYVPKLFNSKGFWPVDVLLPQIARIVMAMANKFADPEKEQDQGIFGSLMHLNDEERPAVFTQPTEFEVYEHNSEKALGAGVNQRFAHPDDGRFNKEATSESGVPVFDQRDLDIFNRNLGAVYNTIETAEKSELEEPNFGLPYINPLDVIVAVQDSKSPYNILLTSFKGSGIPVGRLQVGGSIEEICTTTGHLIVLTNSRKQPRNKIFRYKLKEGFTLKSKYNVDLLAQRKMQRGTEIEPEGERFSYQYTKTDKSVNSVAVSNKQLYVLYDKKIEIRNLDTLAVEKSQDLKKIIREPEVMAVDSRGYVFIKSMDFDEIDKISVLDPDLNFVSKIDLSGQIVENNFKTQKFGESHYLFYSIQNNTEVFCKKISDLSNIEDIKLSISGGKGKSHFGSGIYHNPKTGTQSLYIARIDKGPDGKSWLKVELYDHQDGALQRTNGINICPLNNPDEIRGIKTHGNYIIVGNQYCLLGRHIHNYMHHTKKWEKDIPISNLDSIADFEIVSLEGGG